MILVSKTMEYLTIILTVSFVHLLALVSPGPDFIMCCRNSLTYSRKTGIYTAIGFGIGIAIHIFYSLAGLAVIISSSIFLFNFIKYLGAGYLIYIGIKSFFSKPLSVEIKKIKKEREISNLMAVRIGFLTNVLNPKATLFFLSLFTLVISPETPSIIMGIVSIIMIVNTVLWFSIVAVFLTQKRIRLIFERFQTVFDKTLGGLLILLGLKVALTER